VAKTLLAAPGVLEATASPSGQVSVEFDRERTTEAGVLGELAKLGVKPSAKSAEPQHAGHGEPGHQHSEDEAGEHGHSHGDGGLLGPNSEMIFALTCGTLLGVGFGIEKLATGLPAWLPTSLYVLAYFFGGFYTLREALDNLRLKRFEIDTLMLVAAAGAAALAPGQRGALVVPFSLGHALEHYAMGRAKRAIEALAELAPDTATVRRDGQAVEIPVEELVVGDVVLVRPNERLPG